MDNAFIFILVFKQNKTSDDKINILCLYSIRGTIITQCCLLCLLCFISHNLFMLVVNVME